MRIGLLADIHEASAHLQTALNHLANEQLDAIVQLGDAIDLPRPSTAATIELLAAAGIPGVWGNHDIGFSVGVLDEIRERMEPRLLEYMAHLRPRMTLGGCHFSHVDPYLRPENDPIEFYLPPGAPNSAERAAPSFAAISERVCFVGHYHRWQVTSDAGPVVWDCTAPLVLDPTRRFIVVVGPLVRGEFGVYDTDTCILTAHRC